MQHMVASNFEAKMNATLQTLRGEWVGSVCLRDARGLGSTY